MASHVPLGIQELCHLNSVHIRQKGTTFEGNKYIVLSPRGQVLFNVQEDANCLIFGNDRRSFVMKVLDSMNTEVITLRRPSTFGPSKMDVRFHGALVSVIREQRTQMKPILHINDANNQTVYRIKGPISRTGTVNFEILNMNKVRIGWIQKQKRSFWKEAFSHANKFNIAFPPDLDVRYKAAVLGATILIDFLYFESSSQD